MAFLQKVLRHIQALVALVERCHRCLKARVVHHLGIARGRHAFERLQGLLIQVQRVLGAHQALPRVGVALVFGKHLPVKTGSLLRVIRGLQQARVLQLRLRLETARVRGEGQIERRAQDALGVGIPADGSVRRGKRPQVQRILGQLRPHRRRHRLFGRQGARRIARAILGQQQATPGVRGGRLELRELRKVGDCSLRLLRLQQRTAQPFKGLHAGGPHRKRCTILLLRTGKVVLVQRVRALAHGVPEARRGRAPLQDRGPSIRPAWPAQDS